MGAPVPITCAQDLVAMGDVIARSRICGEINPADGFLVAWTCHAEGISPLEFSQTYHIMRGRVSKRADSILADYQRLGGKYRIVERSSERAAVVMIWEDIETPFEIVWANIQDESFVRSNSKYRTPHSRTQMLWARVASDAVRAVCPQACAGVYTPEEVEDFEPIRVDAAPAAAPQPIALPQQAAVPAPAPAAPVDYSVCPVGATAGKEWAEHETEYLEQVAAVPSAGWPAGFEQGHMDAVLAVLAYRAEGGQ